MTVKTKEYTNLFEIYHRNSLTHPQSTYIAHGFRSNAGNGVSIKDEVDPITGIPIISLYGGTRKPSKKQMDSLDLIVFDIQDVGCRFFTYINKLYDIMEACAENNKELIVLDRPNPNGFVDGPVLDMKKRNLKSLNLNKKSVANFLIKGGVPPITHTSYSCPVDPYTEGCQEPVKWLTEDDRHICRTWH